MYIKQVIIEGFKSYKELAATEPFSPRINCVVGANGSGKSNFFHAIRFVLSDLFQHLHNEDRHMLLHEGTGHQVLSAFVEIVFDNSDNRIPVDKEEVRLRRTVGLKKDEYFLDGKHIKKTEVMNLLESVGFSRSNPYYVVQQGKIASLTLMTDSKRLDLLKEIGGTRVYEERRRESLKIMQDTGSKRNQIIQVVEFLDERLKELDEEKEELRKYQQLDKLRKSLEFVIYEKEINDARDGLAKVEEDRKEVSERLGKAYNSMSDAKEKSNELDKAFKNLTREIHSLFKEKEEIEKQRTGAIEKHAQVELDNRDIQAKISGNIRAKEDAMKQHEILEKEIQDSMEKLNKIKPLYSSQVREEEDIKIGIEEHEKKLSILYRKQGRATQFDSKADHDKWLKKEIDDYKLVLESNITQEGKIKDEIQQLNADLQEQDASINHRRTEIAALESIIFQYREDFNQYKSVRDKLQEERKSLWGEESEISSEINRLKNEIWKTEKSLDHAIPGDVRRGLNFVRRFCKETKMKGVFGPLIELLDCDEKFFTAVEVTAGNSLFHVVVENDEISGQIIRHLNKYKGGRVTFIPLNRVRAPYVSYPQGSDVVPLLKKLEFSRKYNSAFAQVFARTVICKDLDMAMRVACTDGLDCITLGGDQVSKKGGMTGGFYDYKRSKLNLMKIIKNSSNYFSKKEKELKEVKLKLEEVDQKITELIAEQQKNDAKLAHDKSELEQFKQDVRNATKQKESISKALSKKEKLLANVHSQIAQLNANIFIKNNEMRTDLVKTLSSVEKKILFELNPEITKLKEKLVACKTSRIETETRKAELENNLSANLVKRKQELEAVKLSSETEILFTDAEAKKQELIDAKALIDDMTQQLKRASASVDDRTIKLTKIKNKKNELQTLEDNYKKTFDDESKELEQFVSKRNILLAKIEDYSKRIRELGPLSSDSFEKYEKESLKELQKLLHKCSEQLQQFSHVSKKTLDQYVNFTEQREELRKRQAELDAGDEKIKELITVLEQRKDESIERTFKGVAKHFREVFSELVQGGQGFLVMMKKKDGDYGDDDQDENAPRPADMEGRVEKYIGVKVKVSFTGQGKTQSMKQLSGGQKTVVALSLIYAIQRCDTAPFYLFDEIDAALDPQYRTAVGKMICRLADMADTQFITTTFRPELIKIADKIYGVTHKNRVSHVNVVSREEALDFIEQDLSHNAE